MCCTNNAKINARNISIFQMVMSGLLALLCIVMILFLSEKDMAIKGSDIEQFDQVSENKDLANLTLKIILWIYFFACLFSMGFAAVLYYGVQQGNKFKLKLWIVFQFVGLVLLAFDIGANLVSGRVGSGALGFALNLYFLYVVNTYYKEVKQGEVNGHGGQFQGQAPAQLTYSQGQAYEVAPPPNYHEAAFQGQEKKGNNFNTV